MELDLEEGGRVNIVRAGRLQRSKDKQQSGGGGEEGKMCIFQDICFSLPTILSKLDTAKYQKGRE